MPVDVKALAQRFRQLQSDSSGFRATCDEIEKYEMPRVGATSAAHQASSDASATWRDPDVWDFTAPVAITKLAAHIHTNVIPPGLRWGAFMWEDDALNQDEEARKALEVRTDLVFAALAESDFDAEMAAALQEYVGLGNMVVVQEVLEGKAGKWGGLDFTAIPLREAEYEEDERGRMKSIFRHLRWTPVQCISKFGVDGVPQKIRDEAQKSTAATTRLDVIFAVYERPEILAKPVKDLLAKPENRPFGYCYFLLESEEKLGGEGGYYDFPAFHAGWSATPGSKWSHGLGHLALPHVKGLNALVELDLATRALAVDPPQKATERGLLSDLDRKPGGLTIVDSMDDLAPLDDTSKRPTSVGAITVEEQRAELRRLFHEDQLTLKDSPEMSATEAQIRYDIMLKLLGPTIARLLSEFVNPLLMGTYRALLRAGKFPKAPDKVTAENEMRIVYRGAFARSRRTDEVAAIERSSATAANFLKLGFREILDVFRPGEAFRKITELLEVPAGIVASKSDELKNRAERLAMEKRMADAQAAKDEATAAAQAARAGVPPSGAGALPVAQQPALDPFGGVA